METPRFCLGDEYSLKLFKRRGPCAQGNGKMPWVEGISVTYLSSGTSSSLKTAVIPLKPCQMTSTLLGKAYAAAGQAGGTLHMMAVLQAYQQTY